MKMLRPLRVLAWTVALILLAAPALAQETGGAAEPPSRPEAAPADVVAPDSLIAALYDVISGPAGQERDWDRFRSLFAEDARLLTVAHPDEGADQLLAFSVEDFIARADQAFVETGFFERELSREEDRYAGVLHAFSTYASYRTAGAEEPIDRGINSIQLMHDGRRWYIVTIFWDSERSGTPVPPAYLPADTTGDAPDDPVG